MEQCRQRLSVECPPGEVDGLPASGLRSASFLTRLTAKGAHARQSNDNAMNNLPETRRARRRAYR